MADHRTDVIVAYTGRDDYTHTYSGNPPVSAVKRDALRFFELEQSAQDDYELVANGVPLEDAAHLRDLGPGPVNLKLRRKDPVAKGIQ